MENSLQEKAKLSKASSHSQKGFVLAQTLVILPIFFSIGLGLLGVSKNMMLRQKLETLCRVLELKYQDHLASELGHLIKLNRPALALRKKRVKANKLMRLALKSKNPAAIAAATANLAQVVGQQWVLRAKQKTIFSRVKLLNLQKKRDHRRATRELNKAISFEPTKLFLAVYPLPPTSITPSYRLRPGFKIAQQSRTKWRVKGSKLGGVCSASLKKEGQHWKPILKEAKPLSKYLFASF